MPRFLTLGRDHVHEVLAVSISTYLLNVTPDDSNDTHPGSFERLEFELPFEPTAVVA